MVVSSVRIFRISNLRQGGHNVDDVSGFAVKRSRLADVIGPMHNKRCSDPPFMYIMFIQAEGSVGEIRPVNPITLVRVGRAGHPAGKIAVLHFFAIMCGFRTQSPYPRGVFT